MSEIIQNIRLIDRQEHASGAILEVLEGPDGRRVRYQAQPGERSFSQLWTGSEWVPIHHLLDTCRNLTMDLAKLHLVTEDILGWRSKEPS